MNNIANIPQNLKSDGHFCVWKHEKGNNGRMTKVPYNPKTGGYAQANNIDTFSDFHTAYAAFTKGGYDGLGVGIFNGIGAIDIDDCIVDGAFSDMATDIIGRLGSYTELSPSGKGIHIIFTVSDGFVYDKESYYINKHKLGLEVYVSGATSKYLTITGNTINENPIVDGTSKLAEVLDIYMQRNNRQGQSPFVQPSTYLADHFLEIGLEKDEKLKSYWNGSRPLTSESDNDAGLMSKLLYWCNNNADEAIKAFLSSPYASQKDVYHKKKLDRPDYLPNLVAAVMRDRTAAQDNEKWQRKHSKRQEPEDKPRQGLNTISAPDLQKANLPPTEYLVDDFLPMGASILGSPPKSGKSWFVLLLGLRIASGGVFLRWQTKQAGVLYLSYEDCLSRLKERMNKLLDNSPAPSCFRFSTEIVTLEGGLLEHLDEYLKTYPETKLIIIDTFQKIRGQAKHGERWYEHDYREAGAIKEFADKKGIGVLFVTHTSKIKDKDDPFNELMGTNGVSGAMDTMFVIKKASRHAQQATLHMTGRDVEQGEFAIRFNKDTCQWEFIGDADDLAEQEALFEYQTSPIVKTIRALLDESPEKRWTGSAKNLLGAGERLFHLSIAPSSQSLGLELRKLKDLLREQDKVVYTVTPNGNAGYRHHFCRIVEVVNKDTQDNDNKDSVEF
ncbi:MAG: AAA family ATPase [Eubacteriales bacterium]|nr:AAA family ATPase [Eubacteriales bacterium]